MAALAMATVQLGLLQGFENLLASDQIAFTTTSGAPFAGITRSFTGFSQAAEENGDSRVYAGVHFRSACRDGLALGEKIGRRAARMHLLPVAGAMVGAARPTAQ